MHCIVETKLDSAFPILQSQRCVENEKRLNDKYTIVEL